MTFSNLFLSNKFSLYGVKSYKNALCISSLVDLSSEKIVEHLPLVEIACEFGPRDLINALLKAAFKKKQDLSFKHIISNWPWPELYLKDFVPPIFSDIQPLHSDIDLIDRTRCAIKYTTSLTQTFIECLKDKKAFKLQKLDLTGYPSVEVIVKYLASHVLLIYNERNQQEIVTLYNAVTDELNMKSKQIYSLASTFHNKEVVIIIDATIESDDAHMELCKALSVVSDPHATLKLVIRQIDISGLGVARIFVLLEVIDPKYFRIASLQNNGITYEAMLFLSPILKRFIDLTYLDISNNSIIIATESGAEILSSALGNFKKLERLNLSHIYLGSRLKKVLSALTNPLTMLRLRECELKPSDMLHLAQSPIIDKMEELDLSFNNLLYSKKDIAILLYKCSSSLMILELEKVMLDELDFHECFQTCVLCTNLRFVNFSNNSHIKKDLITQSLIYFMVTPNLESVKLSFPNDIAEINENLLSEADLVQLQNQFALEIDKILMILCLMNKRDLLKICFNS